MARRNMKGLLLYEKFKEEAKLVTLKSDTGTRQFIKWRGKIFQTSSFKQVFDSTAKFQMVANDAK